MTDERADGTGSENPEQQPPPSTAAASPNPPGGYPGGYPPPPPYGGTPPPYPGGPTAGPSNGLGIAALVTAIVGLLMVWSVLGGLVLGVVAVALGFAARGRCKRGEATNDGVALSGIVLGFLGIVLSVVFVGIYLVMGGIWFTEVGGPDFVSCMQDAGNDRGAQQQCEDTFRDRMQDEFSVTPTARP